MKQTTSYAMMLTGLALAILSIYPDFTLLYNVSSYWGIRFSPFPFNFTVFTCMLCATGLIVTSFIMQLKEWKAKGSMPIVFLIMVAITATMLLMSMFFGIFGAICGQIGAIAGIVALVFINKAFDLNTDECTKSKILFACITTCTIYAVALNYALFVIPCIILWFLNKINPKNILFMIAAILLVANILFSLIPVVNTFMPYMLVIGALVLNMLGWIKEINSAEKA